MRRAPLATVTGRNERGGALALSLLMHAAAAAALILGLGAGKGIELEPPGEGAVVTVMFAAEAHTAAIGAPDAPVLAEATPEPVPPFPEPDTAQLAEAEPARPAEAEPTQPAEVEPTRPTEAEPTEPAKAEPIAAFPEPDPIAELPAPPRPQQAQRQQAQREHARRQQARREPAPSPAAAATGWLTPGAAADTAGGSDAALPILVTNPAFRSPPRPPAYPQAAIARGIEGTVLIRVLIAPDGTTREVLVHRSSGTALLDRAAVEAVRHWAFMPAAVGGRAVPAWVEVPVRFRLG
jgi:protein TonB